MSEVRISVCQFWQNESGVLFSQGFVANVSTQAALAAIFTLFTTGYLMHLLNVSENETSASDFRKISLFWVNLKKSYPVSNENQMKSVF